MPEKRTIFILPILIRFHAVADNEQGWFPRRPFHWCANHLIDQYRSCKHCQKPLTSLEEFAAKLLAVDRHEDALQVYEVLTDFAHAHAHVCPYTPRILVRRPLREGRYTECVYMLSMTGTPSLKIGRTGQPTPHKRFLELRRGNPTLKVEAFFPCQRSVYMEWFVHKLLDAFRREGEWFETDMPTIEDAMRTALLHEFSDPTYFMTQEQRWKFDEWREDRRNENPEEWLMLEHMGLDIEEFVPIEPSVFEYPWPEELPPYFRPVRTPKKKPKRP